MPMASGDVKTYPALLPLSWLYSLVTRGRNQLFDWGVLEERQFDVPVITVGNLTVGGTGKTPHVEHLVRLLRGETHVAVLSRGDGVHHDGQIAARRILHADRDIQPRRD